MLLAAAFTRTSGKELCAAQSCGGDHREACAVCADSGGPGDGNGPGLAGLREEPLGRSCVQRGRAGVTTGRPAPSKPTVGVCVCVGVCGRVGVGGGGCG